LTPTLSPSVAGDDDNKDDTTRIQKWSQWRRFHSYGYTRPATARRCIRYFVFVGGDVTWGCAAICIGDGLMRKAGPTGTNRQWSRSIFLLFCVTHSSTSTRLVVVYLVQQQTGILLYAFDSLLRVRIIPTSSACYVQTGGIRATRQQANLNKSKHKSSIFFLLRKDSIHSVVR
jgi:hypothetical protein